MPRPVFLSKSKLMSARQCLKRLHLEIHHADLKIISADTEAAFRKGHEIGDISHRIYGTTDSVFIPYAGGLQQAKSRTTELLRRDNPVPIFEATLQYNNVLVRVDVLIPEGDSWRLVEVKASTSVKPEHAFDCAIQAWVFKRSGYALSNVSLAHVDNSFVYQGDGDYASLLIEEDLDDDVEALLPSVSEWVSDARMAASGDEPDVAVGKHCFTPYECPFVAHCWPGDTDYPLLKLGGRARKQFLGELVAEGITDVRDIPVDRLNDTQRHIQEISQSGVPELLDAAGHFVAKLEYPRYYLDFETVAPAVPLWSGTRPYEALPFQWSCHFEQLEGLMQHAEFLDLSGDAPMRRFAESMIRVLGDAGPILVYSSYEKRIIGDCIERFPDLDVSLTAIIDRLKDLLPVAQQNDYHPDMHGSWSIKAVLPTIAPDLNYDELDGIQDGTAASEGYLEAIHEDAGSERKAELKEQLLKYCQFDTLALVRITQFFKGSVTQ